MCSSDLVIDASVDVALLCSFDRPLVPGQRLGILPTRAVAETHLVKATSHVFVIDASVDVALFCSFDRSLVPRQRLGEASLLDQGLTDNRKRLWFRGFGEVVAPPGQRLRKALEEGSEKGVCWRLCDFQGRLLEQVEILFQKSLGRRGRFWVLGTRRDTAMVNLMHPEQGLAFEQTQIETLL